VQTTIVSSFPYRAACPPESGCEAMNQMVEADELKIWSFICTVVPSCKPSSSRDDFARSADKDILERREPLLPKDAPGADAGSGEDTCMSGSPWLEPWTSNEGLRCNEPVDWENVVSYLGMGTVRLGSAWPSGRYAYRWGCILERCAL
jgi:hypothetical protein